MSGEHEHQKNNIKRIQVALALTGTFMVHRQVNRDFGLTASIVTDDNNNTF